MRLRNERTFLLLIETYYDERSAFCVTSDEPAIPYPELVGEELKLWQRYLPTMRELENVPFWLHDNVPHLVMEQLEKAQKTPRLFDRIEIWSRTGDPMAVGVIGGKQTRYFSIARWGDAKLTLEQVKKRLWVEEWMFRLVRVGTTVIFLLATLALIARASQG